MKSLEKFVLLLVVTFMVAKVAKTVPIDRVDGIDQPSDTDKSASNQDVSDATVHKAKICQLICKNNPADGGKFCNCDTYALRITLPNHADCNRLI